MTPGDFPRRSRQLATIEFIVTSAPLLEVTGLSLAFGTHPAVQGISFSIAAGQTLGLVGESGSGKSATSLALLRLLPPSANVTGSIRFDGEDLLTLSESEMRRRRGHDIAMIFQEPMTALNPSMRIGIQIGGIGALVPNRRNDLAQLGLRAMLAGTMANLMSASIVSMLIK